MSWLTIAGAAVSAGTSIIGQNQVQGQLSNSQQNLQQLAGTNFQNFNSPFGQLTQGGFNPSAQFGGALNDQFAGTSLMQQGAFDPNILASVNPAFQQTQAGLNTQQQSNFLGSQQGAFDQAGGLRNQFAQGVQAGPQDIGQQGLFAQGQGFLNQAGNQDQLIQQQLQASNAFAAPQEARQRQNAQESIFSRGGNATTGGRQEFADLLNSQNLAGEQRLLNAQQLGLGQQQRLGNLGIQSFGQGANLFGQAQGAFGQQLQGFGQTGQFQQGLEGQAFGQNIASNQFNMSAGQNRLQNAMAQFSLGEGASQGRFAAGQQGFQNLGQSQTGIQNFFTQNQNADANRIQAQAGFADPLASLAQSRAAGTGGFFSGLGSTVGGAISSIFSDRRLKKNINRIGTFGDLNWYEWDWTDDALAMGIDQPTFGVIADEVMKVKPKAVHLHQSGFLMVNYRELV